MDFFNNDLKMDTVYIIAEDNSTDMPRIDIKKVEIGDWDMTLSPSPEFYKHNTEGWTSPPGTLK